jgi:hypothetical protein
MNETIQSRASVALSQQEYTTLPVSNSRVRVSIRQEDRVITHQLNAEEVSNLIKSHLCDDLEIDNDRNYSLVRSREDNFYGMVKTFPNANVVITKAEHDDIITTASSEELSSLFIAVTPEGVFQFNLSMLRLEFEDYTDVDSGTDIKVADLDVSNGTQILEWYPEFATEDDYIDALMSNGDSHGYDESDTW